MEGTRLVIDVQLNTCTHLPLSYPMYQLSAMGSVHDQTSVVFLSALHMIPRRPTNST